MIALALASSVAPISLWAGTSNVLSLVNERVDNTNFKVFTDSSKVFDIDEVVVVSQPKEAFRLRQQSLSSTSVGEFQIQKLGTRDLRELSSYIPNFVMPNYGSRLSSAMYVRGIGSRVNSPAVGIYLDGIPVMSKSAFNLHHYQTSRIDILRGPQATLYGQNTEGGLVRIYSRNPFEYEGTDLKLSYGSRYYRNVELAHYHRINDHLAFTVAAFNDAQKGFFRNTNTGNRADKYDEAGGKIVLKAKLNRGWNVDLLANYQYVDQNGFPYGKLDLETGKASLPSTTFDGTYLRHSFISGVTVNHTGADYSFASTTSYQYLKDKMNMDSDYLPADYMSILQEQLQNSLTQEFTLKSNRAVGGFCVIGELPPGRRPVETFLVSEALRERLNGFIRRQCSEGHQVYVVCPAVEESEDGVLRSAEAWAQTLQQSVFPDLRVGLLHGKMKSAEKDAALAAFSAGETDILVATTVVEVGVDVPNATLMVIENAERFGLSQLHQLRGRVGRGGAQSYCVLVSGTRQEETKKRLEALCRTTDGFQIAEQDLALRGPGDFFGSRQHGLPLLKVASLQMDLETLQAAQQAAAAVIRSAGSLDAPELAPLKARVQALFTSQEVSLN